MKRLILATLFNLAICTYARAESLSLSVLGLDNKGRIFLELFSAEDGAFWQGTPIVRDIWVYDPSAENFSPKLNVPAGLYALRAYVDENGNETLDQNRRGLPTELVAISNNNKSMRGKKSFRKATFEVKEGVANTLELHFYRLMDNQPGSHKNL